MTLERRLRQTLDRKASEARVTPGAWHGIEERLQGRRSVRTALLAGLAVPVAAALVAVLMVATGGDDGGSDVVAGPRSEAPAPDGSGPAAVPEGEVLGVFPAATRAELEAVQSEVDAGHQPWLLDPQAVADGYLRSRGLTDAVVAGSEVLLADEAGPASMAFRYEHGEAGGTVLVQRLSSDEQSIWFVAGAGSNGIHWARAHYGADGALTVRLAADAPGRVDLRLRGVTGSWAEDHSMSFDAGTEEEFRWTVPGDPPPGGVVLLGVHRTEADELSVVEDVLVAGATIDARGDDGGAREPCRTDLPSPGPEADEALREWFAEQYETKHPVVMPDGSTETLVRTGYDITGDLVRDLGRAEICVRSFWASDPEHGSGDAVGFTDDTVIVEAQGDAWAVTGGTRSPLSFFGEWSTAQVALLQPGAECGESDAEFQLLQAAIVMEGEDPLEAAFRSLFTGWFVVGDADYRHTLPPDARLRSVEVDEQGVAHVDVSSAAERGGGSCLMLARKEQIRRTALAQEGITNVSVTVDGKPEDESFQP